MTNNFLANVPVEWRAAFQRFVSTGEAPDEFLSFLDSHKPTQQAVEAAFAAQVKELNLGVESIAGHIDSLALVTSQLSDGLLTAASFLPSQQETLALSVAARLTPSDAAKALDALELIKSKIAACTTHS